jgi:septum site-determining protein MinC
MSSPASAVPDVSMQIRIDRAVPVLVVPETLDFESLRLWLRDQLPSHAGEIGGRASRLDLGAREIKLFDLRRLIHMMREEFGVEITGLYVQPEALHRYAERELKLKLFLHDAVLPEDAATEPAASVDVVPDVSDDGPPEAEHVAELVAADPDVDAPATVVPLPVPGREEPATRTMAVHRTLRSGTSVRFDGDVVLYGDVNPGAHLVATGNIVVLGALKGMAHAGAGGDEDAFIMALQMRPTQLRIGRKIAVPPQRETGLVPERARVDDGQIVIEPFASRLRT